MSYPIAVLVGGVHLLCLDCGDGDSRQSSAVYPDNVHRYDAHCHDCGVCIVKGVFGTDLFEVKGCRYCAEAEVAVG